MMLTDTVKPIKTTSDYEVTLAEIEALWGSEPNTPAGDRLDVLIALVEAYEAQHHPLGPPDPIEAIKFEMEQRGLSFTDLELYLGRGANVFEILNRQRELTVEMIRQLHKGLQIPLASLIGV